MPVIHDHDTDSREIHLTQNKVVIVDAADFERVNRYRWFPKKSRSGKTWYARRNLPKNEKGGGGSTLLHQFILNGDGKQIDHIDGNGLNCKRNNLRVATNQQNSMNRGITSRNKSGYKGVSWNKNRRKWTACIMIDGRSRFLGLFHDSQDAAKAYDKEARVLHGEFARLNFPNINSYSDRSTKYSNNKSGYRGVAWSKAANKWQVYITFNGRRKHIGVFEDLEEAARAYDKEAIMLYGESAKLNFPQLGSSNVN